MMTVNIMGVSHLLTIGDEVAPAAKVLYNAGGLSFAQSECVYGYEGLLEVDPRLREASWAHFFFCKWKGKGNM